MLHNPRALSSALLWLGCALALAACGGAPPVPLTGTVKDAYTGKPVAAANVSVVKEGDQSAVTSLATDSSGIYSAVEWTSKDSLQVQAPGYEPVLIPLEAQPQLASPSPPAATLDAVLRPNTLSGMISDKRSGKPLAGALVSVAVDASRTISATTSVDGRYTLVGLPEQFKLSVAAPNYEPSAVDVSRSIAQDAALRPNTLTGIVTDRYSDEPVAGAKIVPVGGSTTGKEAVTSADGRYLLENVPADVTAVEVTADGYAQLSQQLGEAGTLDAVLRPDVIKGVLVNKATGKPVVNATIIATTAIPGTDVAYARIDGSADGSFTLEGIPESGFVQVLAPGYLKAVLKLEPGSIPPKIELEPFTSKALYITAAVASAGPDLLNQYLDLIDNSELNTIIVDLKSDLRDDLGQVYYDSQVPIVKELGTARDYMDIKGFLVEAKKRGIYTIARVQIFSHDNALADAKPEWAIKDRATGKVRADYPGPGIRYAWLDPWNRNVWDYNIQLSVEAAQFGFDEINFDYIRYPDWYEKLETYGQELEFSQPTDPKGNPEAMYKNIATFMKESQRAINGAGAFFSVDVFGRVVLGPSMPISQNIAMMAPYADYICPMPYPSLWWSGYLGFDNPTAHPYEVILESTKSGHKLVEGKRAMLRPWLQAHTDPWQGSRVVEYGPAEIKAQIKAVDDFGKAAGWMLYNSANIYEDDSVNPE